MIWKLYLGNYTFVNLFHAWKWSKTKTKNTYLAFALKFLYESKSGVEYMKLVVKNHFGFENTYI